MFAQNQMGSDGISIACPRAEALTELRSRGSGSAKMSIGKSKTVLPTVSPPRDLTQPFPPPALVSE